MKLQLLCISYPRRAELLKMSSATPDRKKAKTTNSSSTNTNNNDNDGDTTKTVLKQLQKSNEAINQIKTAIDPYLQLLQESSSSTSSTTTTTTTTTSSSSNSITNVTNPNRLTGKKRPRELSANQITEAQAAIALTIGTLRYMAARLQGLNRGKDKNDSLRMELDKMKKTLVKLRGLKAKSSTKQKKVPAAKSTSSFEKDENRNSDEVLDETHLGNSKKRKF